MYASVENLSIVWACVDQLCADLADEQWELPTFAALAGGRCDVPDDVVITGDRQLGQQVLASMNLMP